MKLNLGCGKQRLEGFVNVDLTDSDQDVDLSVFPWPWEDGTVDEIVASHVLEHFTRETAKRFIGECYRILKPGGELYIAVPDMDKFIDCHLSNDFSPLNGYHWTDLNHLCGGDETEKQPGQRHKYMYSWWSLYSLLRVVHWFTDAQRRGIAWFDNPAYEAISLYCKAVK